MPSLLRQSHQVQLVSYNTVGVFCQHYRYMCDTGSKEVVLFNAIAAGNVMRCVEVDMTRFGLSLS